ncbi:MAG: alanine racemase [Bacteroidales bacterium]|nr:alanine racemase [Bacteroidales bacterium]
MAYYFAGAGWNDITIAFPQNVNDLERVNRLGSRIHLGITVESADVASIVARIITAPLVVYLKIDTGYHRTGLDPSNVEEIRRILSILSSNSMLRPAGYLAHAGHTYRAGSKEEIAGIHDSSLRQMRSLKTRLSADWPDMTISLGDTPSCSIVGCFEGADEIRPGNFVFYDTMQWQLGSCLAEDIAVAVTMPVAALHPSRNEVVLAGGAVHLSKETLWDRSGTAWFGLVARMTGEGWSSPLDNTRVISLSQEHAVVQTTREVVSTIRPGDTLAVLPVHSCLAIACMKKAMTLKGEMISTLAAEYEKNVVQ